MTQRLRQIGPAYCLLACLLLLAGCENTGPARYDFSGKVMYAGKPVPAGFILIAPDKSKGNDGPGSNAEIKDGVFKTMAQRGPISGPHILTVNAFDGKPEGTQGPGYNPMGKPLSPSVQISVDIPKNTSTYDIDLPAQKMK